MPETLRSVILRVFQAEHGIPPSGEADDAIIRVLKTEPQAAPALISVSTITYEDVRGPFEALPQNLMLQAKLKALNYQSAFEALGEKFHCSPGLLRRLNPGTRALKPSDVLAVPNVHRDSPGKAASVVVLKSEQTVRALDPIGKLIAIYPATIGSEHDPLPPGEWKVNEGLLESDLLLQPETLLDARPSDAKAVIRPGPRSPVGAVWIGLNKEHYGIHGTPTPGAIGHVESHGCVRLTNWDAIELGQMVDSATPVSFRE